MASLGRKKLIILICFLSLPRSKHRPPCSYSLGPQFHSHSPNTTGAPNLVRFSKALHFLQPIFDPPSSFLYYCSFNHAANDQPQLTPSNPHYRHSLGSRQGGPSCQRGPGEVGEGEALGQEALTLSLEAERSLPRPSWEEAVRCPCSCPFCHRLQGSVLHQQLPGAPCCEHTNSGFKIGCNPALLRVYWHERN